MGARAGFAGASGAHMHQQRAARAQRQSRRSGSAGRPQAAACRAPSACMRPAPNLGTGRPRMTLTRLPQRRCAARAAAGTRRWRPARRCARAAASAGASACRRAIPGTAFGVTRPRDARPGATRREARGAAGRGRDARARDGHSRCQAIADLQSQSRTGRSGKEGASPVICCLPRTPPVWQLARPRPAIHTIRAQSSTLQPRLCGPPLSQADPPGESNMSSPAVRAIQADLLDSRKGDGLYAPLGRDTLAGGARGGPAAAHRGSARRGARQRGCRGSSSSF